MIKSVDSFVPVLHVSNLHDATQFFVKLGFNVQFAYGEPVYYHVMSHPEKSDSLFHLFQKGTVSASSVGIYIATKDVDEIFNLVLTSGIEVASPLKDQPYGMRDFSVVGPDAILVTLGCDIV